VVPGEFGLVGFVIFTGFISWFGINGVLAYRRVEAPERALVAGLIAAHLAMIGFSLGIEASFQRSWWLVMGLLAASCALADRPQVRRSNRLTKTCQRAARRTLPNSSAQPKTGPRAGKE